jgi:hypothetical protein
VSIEQIVINGFISLFPQRHAAGSGASEMGYDKNNSYGHNGERCWLQSLSAWQQPYKNKCPMRNDIQYCRHDADQQSIFDSMIIMLVKISTATTSFRSAAPTHNY